MYEIHITLMKRLLKNKLIFDGCKIYEYPEIKELTFIIILHWLTNSLKQKYN